MLKRVFLIVSGLALLAAVAKEYWVPLVVPSTAEYWVIPADWNRDLRNPRVVGIGGSFTVEFDGGPKSIAGYHELSDVRFRIHDASADRWGGEGEGKSFGQIVSGGNKRIHPRVTIRIPDDPALEGRTISGLVMATLSYPVKDEKGVVVDSFVTEREEISKEITLHIFPSDQIARYSGQERIVERFHYSLMFLLAPGIIIIINGLGLAIQESKP